MPKVRARKSRSTPTTTPTPKPTERSQWWSARIRGVDLALPDTVPAEDAYGQLLRKVCMLGIRCYIPSEALDEASAAVIKAALHYSTTEARAQSAYGKSDPGLDLWREAAGMLEVPAAWGRRMIGDMAQVARKEGERLDQDQDRCRFMGALQDGRQRNTPNQVLACTRLLEGWRSGRQPTGFLNLPCGFGKTICAVYLATQLGRATLVLTSTEPQMTEFLETFRRFAPGLTVGVVQRDTCELDRDVVVASIQTLLSPARNITWQQLARFGLTVIDEAHHIAAETMSSLIMERIISRCVLGLSATVRRQDGRTDALFALLGPILHSESRERPDAAKGDLVPVVRRIQAPQGQRTVQTLYDKVTPNHAAMVREMTEDPERTQLGILAAYHALEERTASGHRRKPMLITSIRKHVDEVRQMLMALYPHLRWYSHLDTVFAGYPQAQAAWEQQGATKEQQLAVVQDFLDSILDQDRHALSLVLLVGHSTAVEKKRAVVRHVQKHASVIIAIDHLGKESFNVPDCDTQVTFNPMGDIEQCAGRLLRGGARNPPLFYDICDPYSLYVSLGYKRLHYYRQQGFEIQENHMPPPLPEGVVPKMPLVCKLPACVPPQLLKKEGGV